MKKILIGLAALVVLIVVVLVAAPFLIPVETYKEQIAQGAREATGRELAIKGDFKLSILPRLELAAEDVSFANAPGASTPEMATLKKLLVQLQLWPLLSGEVKVDSFVLVDPVINLEVDKDGKANWDFGKAAPAKAGEEAPAGEGAPGLQQLSLGDVRLENGLVTYRDAQSGQSHEVSDINMTVSLPDLDSPVAADGSLTWNGEKLDLSLKSQQLRDRMAGKTTPVEIALKSKPVNLGYKGTMTKATPSRVEGDIDLDVPSIRALAAWTGNPVEGGGSGLGPLKIKGKVAASGPKVAFTGATIALDQMNAAGDLSADVSGARPYLKGRLDIDRLDLNVYMPPKAEGAAEQGQAAPAGPPRPPEWSDEPIALDGLKAANVDFALTVGEILVQELKIGKSAVVAALKDGLLTLDVTELNLYSGQGKGKLTVDGRGKVPAVAKSFSISGVQAEPLLTDAAGFERLEGTGQIDISITAKGNSQRAMVQALNGKGAVKFVDGAIKGINLAAMARNVGTAFLDQGAGAAQKTDFAELSGTFTITKGIVRNADLVLLNPLLRLTGAGTADMPARTVNYRVEPKVVGTTEGQGGAADVAGVTVPVIIEGPWHDLSYRPDLAGLVEGIAKDPTKALEGVKGTVEQLQEGATGGVGEVLKGVTGEPSGDGDGGALPDPGKTLKKLFGN
jgi:AsmA protein